MRKPRSHGGPAFVRLLGALPDVATACFFAVLWLAPQMLWPQALRTGLLMMLVEFILVHAAGMLGGIVLARDAGTARRWKPVLGVGVLYLVFIAAWAWQFQAWWPLLALAWLLAGKVALVIRPMPDADRRHQLASDWAIGVMAYLAGAAITTLLPIPRLGLTRDVVGAAELPGTSGLWVTHPQSVVAFSVFYFSVLALVKLLGWRLPASQLPAAGSR
ncbi:hypothetical protein [Arenimonas sp.]|uniref:hypothetical protein n=1 Tax=Arenimonas sp. TaxID=1872635 RepID=UPI0035AF3994